MVLQTFDLGLNCGGDSMAPFVADYAPTSSFYTDLDANIYGQGNVRARQKMQIKFAIKRVLNCVNEKRVYHL